VIGEIFEDAKIPVFVSLSKVASGYMSTDTEMVTFGAVRIECNNQGSQPLAVGKLPEHLHQQLVPAGKMLDVAVSAVLLYDSIKFASIEDRKLAGRKRIDH